MYTNLPGHVAIIMDGNGRWATAKGLSRKEGHKEGSYAIDRLLDCAIELGLKNISLYAFSTENWKRPLTEVTAIFELLEFFIEDRLQKITERGVKVLHSGAKSKIPLSSLKKIEKAVEATSSNKVLQLNFCLNYGGQEEILHAFNAITCYDLVRVHTISPYFVSFVLNDCCLSNFDNFVKPPLGSFLFL